MPCVIIDKKGECRWERDGNPVGIFPTKYEWNGAPDSGDCSLKILDANLEFDDGVWQCQVTPSSFSSKDSLISEGAELVVRGKIIHKIQCWTTVLGNKGDNLLCANFKHHDFTTLS